jgi:hypothetical protein
MQFVRAQKHLKPVLVLLESSRNVEGKSSTQCMMVKIEHVCLNATFALLCHFASFLRLGQQIVSHTLALHS